MDDFTIMPEADIRKEYREAKNPQLQLEILAQQNLTTVEHIKAIVENDIRPPYAPKRRQGKPQPEEIRLLKRMWEDGASIDEIAKTLHRSRPSIAAFLKNHRDICPCRICLINDEQKAEIVNRYYGGERAIEIATSLGCSESTVYKTLREARS